MDDENDCQYGSSTHCCHCADKDDPPPLLFSLATLAILFSVQRVAPHVKPFLREKVQPKMTRMRDKVTKRVPVEAESAEDVDD